MVNPQEYIRQADILVTAEGHNSIMEAGAAGVRFIAIAEERPFGEQVRKVAVLDREGLAIGLDHWPIAAAWPDLIARTEDLDPARWKEVFRGNGARQAAEYLEEIATWSANLRRGLKDDVLCPSVC